MRPSGRMRPMVPRLAALLPSPLQICRTKVATEVLPLVPVTAVTVSGWPLWKRDAMSASARRGSDERTTVASPVSGSSTSQPARMTAAPFLDGLDDVFGAIGLGARHRREHEPRLDLAAVRRDPLDLDAARQAGRSTSRRRGVGGASWWCAAAVVGDGRVIGGARGWGKWGGVRENLSVPRAPTPSRPRRRPPSRADLGAVSRHARGVGARETLEQERHRVPEVSNRESSLACLGGRRPSHGSAVRRP